MQEPSGREALAAELARVELALAHATRDDRPLLPPPPAASPFARAAERFGLDPRERFVLSVAAAAELAPRGAGAAPPTVGLAMIAAGGDPMAFADVFEPDAPLQAWALIALDGAGPLPARILRLAPGVRDLVAGRAPRDDDRPRALDELALPAALRQEILEAARWIAAEPRAVVIVTGAPDSGRDAVAAALAGSAGARSLHGPEAATPDALRRLLRDARWHDRIAIARAEGSGADLAPVVVRLGGPLVLIGASSIAAQLALRGVERIATVHVPPPGPDARARMWAAALPIDARDDDLDVIALGHSFRIGPAQIAAASRLARAGAEVVTPTAAADAARAVSISNLDALAQHVPGVRSLDELIVPASVQRELALALAWARHGPSVFAAGGPGERLRRGPGLACLFHGPPGTGKTLAAHVLASAIGLPLYRVDLAQVMDKYIGETEKRLERLFTEAERGNAVLLFDEADVLFARRTEVKDARDRYANLETGFLLQRIERHPGIVVLATNLRDNLDPAFLRRIHIVAELPAPQAAQRAAIWRCLAPADRAADVDVDWLAHRFALTGGEINNAVATGTLVASAAGRTVAMEDLVYGVWRESCKTGRLVEADQFGPWAARIIALAGELRAGRAERS